VGEDAARERKNSPALGGEKNKKKKRDQIDKRSTIKEAVWMNLS